MANPKLTLGIDTYSFRVAYAKNGTKCLVPLEGDRLKLGTEIPLPESLEVVLSQDTPVGSEVYVVIPQEAATKANTTPEISYIELKEVPVGKLVTEASSGITSFTKDTKISSPSGEIPVYINGRVIGSANNFLVDGETREVFADLKIRVEVDLKTKKSNLVGVSVRTSLNQAGRAEVQEFKVYGVHFDE